MDLVARVKGILLTPKTEWDVIDTEPTTVASLYSGYVVPLALIPAVMLGLLFVRRSGWTRADTAASVAMWALPAAAVFVAGRLVVSQPLYPIMNFSQLDVGHAIFPLAPMLGLGLIPFAAALALRPPIPNRDTVWSLGIAVLAVVGVVGCLVDLARFGMIFPGNVFSPLGFTATLAIFFQP